MSQNDIQEIELSIEEARKNIERGERALRLSDNLDFKAVVLDGYFRDEAARLTLLSSDPAARDYWEFIENDLKGIGAFKRYLSTLVQLKSHAENAIADAEEELEAIRAEEGADE